MIGTKQKKRDYLSVTTLLKRGDVVRVMAGKEKGKEGTILRSLPREGAVLVERLNLIKKATRPTQQNQKGGIIQKEGKIALSNVMILCPFCNKPARIAIKVLQDGEKVRSCRRCDEILVSQK